MLIPDVFFHTERLTFRPFAAEDLDGLAAVTGDPEVVRYVADGRPLPPETAANWIANSRANVARRGHGSGALVERATGRMIGWAGIAYNGDDPPEIIYGLARSAWGRGYGREIAAALTEWALGPCGLPEIHATVEPSNTASVRILQGLGYTLVAADDVPDEHGMRTHRYMRRAAP